MHKPVIIGLIGELRREIHHFVRQESDLVRAEFREKIAYFRRSGALTAGGGVAAYAAFIVFLAGSGFLFSLCLERLGLDAILARAIGFSLVGLLTSGVGVILLLSSFKVLSRQTIVPEKTVDTLQRIAPVQIQSGRPSKPDRSRSSKDLETNVLATERRLAKTLEKLTDKANPMRYVNAAVAKVQAHPYQWGLVAFGAGFLSSFILLRQLSGAGRSS